MNPMMNPMMGMNPMIEPQAQSNIFANNALTNMIN